ncbi:ester cyclase [Virgibacillus subterraneus]|uniref:ester cyclase n=1 Tax=Virgibacillus subterraneus TaxID=621109 RepID=UPI000B812907|nr:ester cyclase [Virgibacillus subterraneus]
MILLIGLERFSLMTFGALKIIGLEDKVAVRYTGHMTYKGGWEDIPSSDQRVKETGIMIIRFESGLIKEMWCEMSDLDVMNQLKK